VGNGQACELNLLKEKIIKARQEALRGKDLLIENKKHFGEFLLKVHGKKPREISDQHLLLEYASIKREYEMAKWICRKSEKMVSEIEQAVKDQLFSN
jgi:hypothetical protein